MDFYIEIFAAKLELCSEYADNAERAQAGRKAPQRGQQKAERWGSDIPRLGSGSITGSTGSSMGGIPDSDERLKHCGGSRKRAIRMATKGR